MVEETIPVKDSNKSCLMTQRWCIQVINNRFFNSILIIITLVFSSLIRNEVWIELQIYGAVFRKFVLLSGKFQVNSDWLIKTGFWYWILEWPPNIKPIFLSTNSLYFLILFLPIFYSFLHHYSAKKIFFFLYLITLTIFQAFKVYL